MDCSTKYFRIFYGWPTQHTALKAFLSWLLIYSLFHDQRHPTAPHNRQSVVSRPTSLSGMDQIFCNDDVGKLDADDEHLSVAIIVAVTLLSKINETIPFLWRYKPFFPLWCTCGPAKIRPEGLHWVFNWLTLSEQEDKLPASVARHTSRKRSQNLLARRYSTLHALGTPAVSPQIILPLYLPTYSR